LSENDKSAQATKYGLYNGTVQYVTVDHGGKRTCLQRLMRWVHGPDSGGICDKFLGQKVSSTEGRKTVCVTFQE